VGVAGPDAEEDRFLRALGRTVKDHALFRPGVFHHAFRMGKEEVLRGVFRVRKIDQGRLALVQLLEEHIVFHFHRSENRQVFGDLPDDAGQLFLLD